MILRWVNPLLGPLEGVGPGYIDFTLIVISISNCLTLKQAAPFMKLACCPTVSGEGSQCCPTGFSV
jgi:hypothetical protein